MNLQVISGVVKWCWCRLQSGIVGWDAYELFKVGEYGMSLIPALPHRYYQWASYCQRAHTNRDIVDSVMDRDAFKTFIPISVPNGARQRIIFDFFDLIAAIAAHGKSNGLGGRKLSRMAAWWAFEHKDTGNGFEGGYNSWLRCVCGPPPILNVWPSKDGCRK